MHKYKAYDEKAMRQSTRIAAIISGIALIVLGIITTAKYSIPVGVIILLATIMKKETYITVNGIEVVYNILFFKHTDEWSFDDITEIHREIVPDDKYYVLHFMKDVMSRRLVFLREDALEIIDLASEMNSNIHFDDVNND